MKRKEKGKFEMLIGISYFLENKTHLLDEINNAEG
jgi:hypothetical protein